MKKCLSNRFVFYLILPVGQIIPASNSLEVIVNSWTNFPQSAIARSRKSRTTFRKDSISFSLVLSFFRNFGQITDAF
jgi:hypothetical protein